MYKKKIIITLHDLNVAYFLAIYKDELEESLRCVSSSFLRVGHILSRDNLTQNIYSSKKIVYDGTMELNIAHKSNTGVRSTSYTNTVIVHT